DVSVHGGDAGGVHVLVVDEEHVVVRVPAVVVAPGEFERDDVAGDAQPSFEPLPGSSGRDLLPGGTLGRDESGEPVAEVVRDGDGDEASGVAGGLPGGEGVAEFVGAAVMDLGGADGAQPDVAAGF